MTKEKYYTVWKGVNPGVYNSWTDCQLQIKSFKGALYKSFNTKEEAEHAFASPAHEYIGAGKSSDNKKTRNSSRPLSPLPETFGFDCLAVDAACSGNPGAMEYRGVYIRTREQIFHYGPVHGTNNIGEFLAIVHGLALIKQKGLNMPIYSDSRTAISWVKQKKCKTTLVRNNKTEGLFIMVERAENWLKNNDYSTPIYKWETEEWGEIPADFGRK